MNRSSDYQTVAKAIRYLACNHLHQPTLTELAAHLGISKFYLQRLFTRWAGVSPKRFLQFLTLEHAKGLLQKSEPVLATAFASGLSGPARLHDLFVSTEAVTPGEYKSGGLELRIGHGVHPTPFGLALIGHTSRGLCHLDFLGSDSVSGRKAAVRALRSAWPAAVLEEAPEETGLLAQRIFPHRDPERGEASLSLLLKGTNFQLKVWNALLRVPAGTALTYRRLAQALGKPTAARAVGSAVGRNPIAYLIPCHRVIREMGNFGQYRWGRDRKAAILAWEAAREAS